MTKLISNNKNLFRELENFDHSKKDSYNTEGRIIYKGKSLVNLASNDYLGLSKDNEVINTSLSWLKKYGTSLSSSRLITGNLNKISIIEKLISKNIKHEKSIIVGNGFLLNSTLIPTLTGNNLGSRKKCYIFSDKYNHASINFGCIFSRQKLFRYRHLDYNHLESLLKKVPIDSRKIIISETLFSMDGDFLDVKIARFLSKKYNALLYLDEAHAFGVFGKNGSGLSGGTIRSENEIVVGTFSKAMGSYGSFVSCSNYFHKIIVNYCSGLIYSTVLPPSNLGSIYAAVKKIPKVKNLRKKIKNNFEYVLKNLKTLSFNTSNSNSHIIPIVLNNSFKCQNLVKYLFKNGFFVKYVRPPTVPINQERIRLSITSTLKKSTLEKFINTLLTFKRNEI